MRDDAEFDEIQMSVQALQGVKCPGDFFNALFESESPLFKFQIKADLQITGFGSDRQHMRMNRRMTVFKSRKAISKTEHSFSLESAENNRSSVLTGNEHIAGYDVYILKSPSLTLDIFDTFIVRSILRFADNELPVVYAI